MLGLLSVPHAAVAHNFSIEGSLDMSIIGKFFVAGGIGCCFSHALATPFDVIKTRLQTNPDRYVNRTLVDRIGEPLDPISTGFQIAKEEGATALCQGMKTTFFGYLLQGSVKYSLWETFKWEFGFGQAVGASRIGILIVAALVAETFATMVLCPFERIRIKLVTDPEFGRTGVLEGIRGLTREKGVIGALYGEGLPATLVKQYSYTVAKLTCFALICLEYRVLFPEAPRWTATLVSSLFAGIIASLSSQPGDTLQVCTSTNSKLRDSCPVDLETGEPPSLLFLARSLGWQALFTGWRARLYHVEAIVVTQLLMYDAVLHALGL